MALKEKITRPLSVLLAEDDLLAAKGLIRELENVLPMGSEILGPYENHEEAVYAIAANSPDLAILDIELGDDQLAGVKIGQILNKRGIPVIYITGLPDEVAYLKALDTNPSDFLKKPFDKESLLRAIVRIVRSPQSPGAATTFYNAYEEDRLRVTTGRSKYEIYWIKEVAWVEVDDKFIRIGLIDGKVTGLITFSLSGFYQERLSMYNQFYLLSRKHIINLNYIERIEGNQAIIKEKQFSIPPPKKDEILERLGGKKQ